MKALSKSFLLDSLASLILFAIVFIPFRSQGQNFESVIQLTTASTGKDTGEKPQSKVWKYDGKWWSVFSGLTDTYIMRLDGTTWTSTLKISTKIDIKADCKVVGNLVHIFLWRGSGTQQAELISVEYDTGISGYKRWTNRPTTTYLSLPSGTETGTIDIDGTGKMWLATDAVTDILVYWNDFPYAAWSAPITLATNVTADDISDVIAMPVQGQIGVFWSDQTSKRFGFRTHQDGDDPSIWSANEIPASQSAINHANGMSDDHMHISRSSDGTLYCAVKTSYDTPGYPKISLLIRRPTGIWDNLYPVTDGGDTESGTRAIILLNEPADKLTIVYSGHETGADILYKRSSMSTISFGPAQTLISGSYDNSTSTKDNYTSDIVILASTASQIVGVLASDTPVPPVVNSINYLTPASSPTNANSLTFRVNFSESVINVDAADFTKTLAGSITAGAVSVTGSGNTYDVTVASVAGNGTVRVDVLSSATITDGVGNAYASNFTSGQVYTVDQVAPVFSATAPASGSTVVNANVSYTLSEALASGTITWTRTGGTADGTVHTQTLTGTELAAGAHTNITLTNNPTLVSGAIYNVAFAGTDAAGNAAAVVTSTSVTFDNGSPTVASISYLTPATSPTNATSLTFRVTFNEPVVNVDAADFTKTLAGGITAGTVSVTGSGAAYDVTVASVAGNGTVRLDVLISATIADGVGNVYASNFTSGQVYTVDQAAPVFSATAPTSGSTVGNANVSYTLSEILAFGTITWTRTGGTADGTVHTQTLTGTELGAGAHTNIVGQWCDL